MAIADFIPTEVRTIPRSDSATGFTRVDQFDRMHSAGGGFGARLRIARPSRPPTSSTTRW